MTKLTSQSLPPRFGAVLLYGSRLEAYCAENEADIGPGDVFKINFDAMAESITDVKKVPWHHAIMPSRMGGEEYVTHNDVKLDALSSLMFAAVQDYQRTIVEAYEHAASEKNTPHKDRESFKKAIASTRKKYRLDTPQQG